MPLKPSLIACVERCYDALLAEGLAFHAAQPALVSAAVAARHRGRPARRVGHNLLLRLSTRKQDVLRFLTDPQVPFSRVGDWRGRARLGGVAVVRRLSLYAGASFPAMRSVSSRRSSNRTCRFPASGFLPARHTFALDRSAYRLGTPLKPGA
jgi:hypothetical protein